MVKVDIVSGFLGAGKTTLINELIKQSPEREKLLLIENEFGEICVDKFFLEDSGVKVTELNSGCICCTLVGDFVGALCRAAETLHPDRIIIEPSGVAKLSDIVRAVEMAAEKSHKDVGTDIEIGHLMTVVDCSTMEMFIDSFGEFYQNQIANASVLFLTRAEGFNKDKLDKTVARLREVNESAEFFLAAKEHLDDAIACAYAHGGEHHHEHHHDHDCHEHHHDHDCHEHHHGHDCHEHHHDHDCHEHHHDGDEVFESRSRDLSEPLTEAQIVQLITDIKAEYGHRQILRIKGTAPAEGGGTWEINYVPDSLETVYVPRVQETHGIVVITSK